MHLSAQPVIIGVTGHYQESYLKEAREAGMTDIYSKPFYQKSLDMVLKKYDYKF